MCILNHAYFISLIIIKDMKESFNENNIQNCLIAGITA